MNILVTGCAGFIGFHCTQKLLQRGDSVHGIDNLNDYYDPNLKKARLEQIEGHENFTFHQFDIIDYQALLYLFKQHQIQRVIHLAAQAGVRHSLTDPFSYIEINIRGFINILEACRHCQIEHLVYASSSSVYGASTDIPFSVHGNTDHPLSIYAATKKSNELMAHTYSHLYQLPTTGMRFFTVYGPWGRPDMSLFLFTRNIIDGKAIDVFNNGQHVRDFTYIDDIVAALISACDKIAEGNTAWQGERPDPASSMAPYRLYNVAHGQAITLMDYIKLLEDKIGRSAQINFLPLQPGDVMETSAEIESTVMELAYKPETPVATGIGRFVDWYQEYYGAFKA